MKTATIPPVRIDPAFRVEIEQALDGGESLATLVETAVRHEIMLNMDSFNGCSIPVHICSNHADHRKALGLDRQQL